MYLKLCYNFIILHLFIIPTAFKKPVKIMYNVFIKTFIREVVFMSYTRGQIAKLANINTETLRYYEKINLISPPIRNSNGYRMYPEEIVDKLGFIKYAKDCGFTLEEIKELFMLIANTSVELNNVSEIVDAKIEDINNKISNLEKMKYLLQQIKYNVDQPNCRFIYSIFHKNK